MFGVSILSVILALGFEWGAHRIRPPRKDGPGGGRSDGPKEKVPALVMFQHWAHTGLLLMSGLFWAVAFWPIVGQLNWTWLVVGGSIAFFVLLAGCIVECLKDHKPDRPSFISARLLPTLLLIAIVNFGVLTTAITDQVGTYQSNFNSTTVQHPAPAKTK